MKWLTEPTKKANWLTRSLSTGSVLVLLTGCATNEPEVRTLRIEVPVLVPCKTQGVSVPTWAAIDLKKVDSLEVKVRALLAERRQRIGFERELAAAIEACR